MTKAKVAKKAVKKVAGKTETGKAANIIIFDTPKLKEVVAGIKATARPVDKSITGIVYMFMEKGIAHFRISDGVNTLTFKLQPAGCDGKFEASFAISKFIALLEKMTTKQVKFELGDGFVKITGNGNYNFATELDPSTQQTVNLFEEEMLGKATPVKLAIKKFNEIATLLEPATKQRDGRKAIYSAFYFGKVALTTNADSAILSKAQFFNSPVLLDGCFVSALNLFKGKDLNVEVFDNGIVAEDDTLRIAGIFNFNVEDYPVKPLVAKFEEEYSNTAKISKEELDAAVERFLVFNDVFGNVGVEWLIAKDKLIFKHANVGEEIIKLDNHTKVEAASLPFNMVDIKNTLSRISGKQIDIAFSPDALKVITPEVQVLQTVFEVEYAGTAQTEDEENA